MILFWLICIALTAIALAFVLPPLWQRNASSAANNDKEANIEVYRDQLSELQADRDNGTISPEQYSIERDEIERRLLEDVASPTAPSENGTVPSGGRRFAYALAIAIPVLAAALYFKIGRPDAITASTAMSSPQVAPNRGMRSQQDIEANVDALAKRLEQNRTDANGWVMLGRSCLTLEKYKEAAIAFARASALKPDDADLLADYAFALGMANGQRLRGQPSGPNIGDPAWIV